MAEPSHDAKRRNLAGKTKIVKLYGVLVEIIYFALEITKLVHRRCYNRI
jgi:hypothetical protein